MQIPTLAKGHHKAKPALNSLPDTQNRRLKEGEVGICPHPPLRRTHVPRDIPFGMQLIKPVPSQLKKMKLVRNKAGRSLPRRKTHSRLVAEGCHRHCVTQRLQLPQPGAGSQTKIPFPLPPLVSSHREDSAPTDPLSPSLCSGLSPAGSSWKQGMCPGGTRRNMSSCTLLPCSQIFPHAMLSWLSGSRAVMRSKHSIV